MLKKVIIPIAMFLGMLVLIAAYSAPPDVATGSGEQTADAAVVDNTCVLTAVHIITDGSNNAKVILYDNASAASGTVRFEMTVTGGSHYGGRAYTFPKRFDNGIYADVSGTGASYIIEYIE